MVFSLQNITKNLFSNKYLTIVLILLIFLGISIYVYYTYVLPKLDKKYVDNKEYVEEVEEKKVADLYYFYTTWCPYCKKARPEWDAFKDEYKDKTVKGWKINFIEIDCEEQDEVASKFGVNEYPTIKLIRNDQIIEYDAKPKAETLMEFINKML